MRWKSCLQELAVEGMTVATFWDCRSRRHFCAILMVLMGKSLYTELPQRSGEYVYIALGGLLRAMADHAYLQVGRCEIARMTGEAGGMVGESRHWAVVGPLMTQRAVLLLVLKAVMIEL